MSTRDQLEWEARWAVPAAVSAFATVLLLIVGTTVRQAVALADGSEDERQFLNSIHDNATAFMVSSGLQALAFLTLIGVLYYLGRAVLARRPELPSLLVWLGVVGPLLLAGAGVLSDVGRLDTASDFVALESGEQTAGQAEDMLEDGSVAAAAIGSGGTLALAVAFVFLSINAMRVGLLTRFMGIVGAIIGALYVIPILAGPLVVQFFWLVALGVLFLGRWPGGGRGPAWETGEAIEWPSARQRVGEGEADSAESLPPADAEPAPDEDDAEATSEDDDRPRRASRKRKRR